MRPALALCALALCALALAAGCAPEGEHAGHGGAPNTTPDTTYLVRGVYLGPRQDSAAVRLHHEDIPGVMGPMAMDFRLQDPAALRGLAEGDSVVFHLEGRGEDYTVGRIAPIQAGP